MNIQATLTVMRALILSTRSSTRTGQQQATEGQLSRVTLRYRYVRGLEVRDDAVSEIATAHISTSSEATHKSDSPLRF